MLGLPQSTEVNRLMPKAQLYKKFELKQAQRDAFDADIARMEIVNFIAPQSLPGIAVGTEVKAVFVVDVELKRSDYDTKNIILISKLIPHRIIFALLHEDKVQLAVYHTKLFTAPWQSADDVCLSLSGLNLDAVWQNIVAFVGELEVAEGNSLTEQIRVDEERTRLMRQIETLERQMRSTSQPRRQRELYSEIKRNAMIKASASSCFHYTKRITTLKSILQNGLRYSYAFEEFPKGVVEALSNELTGFLSDNVLFPEVKGAGIAIPMISFCDIPLSRSHQHVRKYGRYAIGLNRDYLLDAYEKFFNPVIYSHCQDLKDSLSFFASEMRYTCIRMRHYIESHRMDLPEPPHGKIERQKFLNSLPHELQEDINHHFNESYYLRILLSLYKPIYLKDLRGKIQNFYDEHEWRLYLPDYDVFRWVVNLTKEEYSEEIKSFNAEIAKQEFAYVKICSSNYSAINHIIVKNNQERNSIIKFIMESPVLFGCSVKKYDTQRQYLVSKITSFEDIEKDY